MGWAILRHAIAMVWRNLGAALRVSVVPLLLELLASAPSLGLFGADSARLGGWALIPLLAALLAFAWTAVAWHRFILLEERPGLVPPIHLPLILAYTGRLILLGLVVIVAAMIVAIPLLLAVAVLGIEGADVRSGAGFPAVILVATILLGWFATRLSLSLPAGAVGRPMHFRESWRKTSSTSGAILVTAVALPLLDALLSLSLVRGLEPGPVASILYILGRQAIALFGLSILTTLYGHLMEGRALG